MAAAQPARNARTAPRRAPARRARPPIRWDRVSRLAMLVVLVGILALYVGPIQSYFATRHRAAAISQTVQSLKAANQRLRERRKALSDPATLERDARALGMLRPGEKPYVLRGLPKGN